MSTTLLRPMETARRCGIGRSTLFAMVRAGTFPQPRRITKRNVGFLSTDVEAWIEALPTTSDSNKEA